MQVALFESSSRYFHCFKLLSLSTYASTLIFATISVLLNVQHLLQRPRASLSDLPGRIVHNRILMRRCQIIQIVLGAPVSFWPRRIKIIPAIRVTMVPMVPALAYLPSYQIVRLNESAFASGSLDVVVRILLFSLGGRDFYFSNTPACALGIPKTLLFLINCIVCTNLFTERELRNPISVSG